MKAEIPPPEPAADDEEQRLLATVIELIEKGVERKAACKQAGVTRAWFKAALSCTIRHFVQARPLV